MKFYKIINNGFLAPQKDIGHSQIWDIMAGDNDYVFLSLGKSYLEEYDNYAYGLIFDALQLIQELNAILGLEDSAFDYYKATLKALDNVYGKIPTNIIVPYQAVGNYNIGIHSSVRDMPIEKQYLYHAVYSRRYDLPGVKEFHHEFKNLIKQIHNKKRFVGKDALKVLKDWINMSDEVTRSPEILVPNKLPVSYAIGYVKRGKSI